MAAVRPDKIRRATDDRIVVSSITLGNTPHPSRGVDETIPSTPASSLGKPEELPAIQLGCIFLGDLGHFSRQNILGAWIVNLVGERAHHASHEKALDQPLIVIRQRSQTLIARQKRVV